jgi:hypothetical protein
VWVLAFFVMGMLMGLLLLVLQQKDGLLWRQTKEKLGSVGLPLAADSREKVEPMLCDRQEAEAVYEKARSLATIIERDGRLQLRLGGDWEYYTAGHRRGFVEAFAEADRCLQGSFRPIRFSYRGEEVATFSAEGALQMK